MKRLTQRFRSKKQNRTKRRKFGSQVENLEQRRMMFGDASIVVDQIDNGIPPIIVGKPDSPSCIDFENLASSASYNVGDSFVADNSGLQATFTGEPFEWSNGVMFNGGSANVSLANLAAHSGQEIGANNILLDVDFGQSVENLSMKFGEYGGNLNLSINGDSHNFQDFSVLNGAIVGGTLVTVANGFGNDAGEIKVDGVVNSFAFGGQELWVDHICAQPVEQEYRIDWGDAPDQPYPTLAASNGARHIIDPDVFLGMGVDGEADGQPDANSLGDDTASVDDEDGVVLLTPMVPGQMADVRVTASTDGYLNAWIDFDQDANWSPADQVFSAQPLSAGVNVLSFPVPNTAAVGDRAFSRWRFSTTHKFLTPDASPFHKTPNGEVEDHRLRIIEGNPDPRMDWGDAADKPYPTLAASNGARHEINPDVFLGYTVDAEPDGQPSINALRDDANGGVDDEDGVQFLTPLTPGGIAQVEVKASTDGWLNAWVDFDQDGNWSPADKVFHGEPLVAGVNILNFAVPATAAIGDRAFSRWRFSTTHQKLGPEHNPNERTPDGEVEDYRLRITQGNPEPHLDWGDAPDQPYPTLSANNGARHEIDADVFLGYTVDSELDGQPSPNAERDDLNGGVDDEDGVQFLTPLVPGGVAEVEVIASTDGYLNAWIDFDRNGVWSGGAENIFSAQPLAPGSNILAFNVPATTDPSTDKPTFSRWRFSTTDPVLAPHQDPDWAPNGEVEDHLAFIEPQDDGKFDWGDAPDQPYPTLSVNGGAFHEINPDVFLGYTVDGELDGQPSPNAQRDDVNGGVDDEDGVQFLTPLVPGGVAQVEVIASTDGYLNAWIDFDRNGVWSGGPENIFSAQPLVPGSNILAFNVPASTVAAPNEPTFSRWRFSTTNAVLAPRQDPSFVPDGEVEDHLVFIDPPTQGEIDWGDAPDQPYPTLAANDGARHIIDPDVFLGSTVDAEPDGQPSSNAQRDDANGGVDDEDGVHFLTPLVPGGIAQVEVIASTDGYLNAWIDFDRDGVWSNGAENIFSAQPLSPGSNILTFNVPAGTVPSSNEPTYSRWRFSTTDPVLAPHQDPDYAPNGEVEDHLAFIDPPAQDELDFGDAPKKFPTLLAHDGARHIINPEIYMGNRIDAEADGQPSLFAKRDDVNGIDDEDGVVFVNSIVAGTILNIDVSVSVDGHLDAWIDFNQDRKWDPSEQIAMSHVVVAGMNTVSVGVPTNAVPNPLRPVYSRFRFSLDGGLAPTGIAKNGEVEDYAKLNGDIDIDGTIDVRDIDLLGDLIRVGSLNGDLNNDGEVNGSDMDYLVQDIMGTNYGDANLDRLVNTDDLVHMFIAGEYLDGDNNNSGWSEGDFNFDQDFNQEDLVKMFVSGAYMAPAAVSAEQLASAQVETESPAADETSDTDSAPTNGAESHAEKRQLIAMATDSVFGEAPSSSDDADESPSDEELDEFFTLV